jgi:hypothetical protein
MAKLGYQELDDFIHDVGTRYDAYSRNKTWDKTTGSEVIIPVSQNAQVRHELQCTIDELCAFYLSCSAEDRAHIRKLVQAHRALHKGLLAHVGWAGQHVDSSQGIDWVRRGLAAASIEDNREDFRDMFIALGGLYLDAVRVGIDVSDCFQEAAELSSSVAGSYSKASMREYLASFEQSEYFKQSILPKLPHK